MRIVQVSVGSVRMPPAEGWAPMQVMINTSKHLARMGHEVVVLDRKHSNVDSDVENVDGISIVRLKAPVARLDRAPRFLRFLLAEFNAVLFTLWVSRYLARHGRSTDAIHVHYSSIGLVLAFLNRGLRGKMFYTCHLSHWALAVEKLTTLERLEIAVDSFFMRRVNKVIALSDSAKKAFMSRGKVRADSIVVVPNGVDAEFFSPGVDFGETARQYGLEGKTTVLFVGRLARIKGVDHLMEVAHIIVNEFGHADVRFVLVGSPAFDAVDKSVGVAEIEAYVRRRSLDDNVILTGSLPLTEVRKLYAAADIFLLPSLGEGDPLVTLEAMASGKPIVATAVGGVLRQVRDGWNGFLVERGDVKQLAERTRELVENPDQRQRMGRNARKLAEEEFDWKAVAEKLVTVYQG
jgi:glycosyltransferase involved in cell wall biosynthesis